MGTVKIEAGGDAFSGELVASGFGEDLAVWPHEGAGSVSLDGGVLVMDSPDGGHTVFFAGELPADVLVRFVCRIAPSGGNNNINLISHCRPQHPGEFPVVADGAYQGYHQLPGYIATFVNDSESPGRTRLRRNPGFELIQETRETASDENRDYEIVFVAMSGRVMYYIDGERVHDWTDPDPHGGGFFALRTWKTALAYSDIQIAALEGGTGD